MHVLIVVVANCFGNLMTTEQMLFDHWLLVEMRGGDPARTGQKLLVLACGLRARMDTLLSGALREAEHRRGMGNNRGWRRHAYLRDHSSAKAMDAENKSADARRGNGSDSEEGMEDLPPLLRMARRAWLDGSYRRTGREAVCEPEADWAQEAEDLSVELADFMLQSIG